MVELSPGLTGVKDLTRLMGECSERVWVVFYCKYVYYSYFKALTLNPWELATTRTTPTRAQRTEREWATRMSTCRATASGDNGESVMFIIMKTRLALNLLLASFCCCFVGTTGPNYNPARSLVGQLTFCCTSWRCVCRVSVRATPTFYCI